MLNTGIRGLLLPSILCGNVLVLVVVGEVLAKEMRHAPVVFCNKVKSLGLGGEKGSLDCLAARIRNRPRHQSLELAGVVGAVAVELALVDGPGQVPEDEPHRGVCPERHADAEPVVEHACDQRTFFGDSRLFFHDAGEG